MVSTLMSDLREAKKLFKSSSLILRAEQHKLFRGKVGILNELQALENYYDARTWLKVVESKKKS